MTLPFRLRLLLINAYAICALILGYLALIGWQLIKYWYFNRVTIALNLLVMLPFLWNALLIILLANRYYPAKETSKLHRNSMIVSVILAGMLQLFILLGSILAIIDLSHSNTSRFDTANSVSIIILTAIVIIAILQIFNSIEGFHLIKTIQRNYRKQLMESL